MANQKNIQTHLKIMEACGRANVPVMFVGAPGIGKTAILEQFCDNLNYRLDVQLLSTQDNTDVTGLPVRTDVGGVFTTEYATPRYQLDIVNNPKTLLFLDEMNNGAPSVQSAWLTILQSRRFPNGMTMNKDTWIVGAMNPRTQSADGWELSYATTNRICFIPFEVPFSFWRDWMLENQSEFTFAFDNLKEEDIKKAEYEWKYKIINFLESTEGREYEQRFPKLDADPTAYGAITDSEKEIFKMAWCSRRSWYNAAKVMSYLADDKLAINIALNGLVGYAAAVAFLEFVDTTDKLPSASEVVSNPKLIDWKNEYRMDRINKLFRNILELKDKDDEVYDLFKYVIKDGRADLVTPYMFNDDGTGFIQKYKGKKDIGELTHYWAANK